MIVAGGNLGVAEIPVRFVGGTVYEALPGLGKLEPGRSWVSLGPSSGGEVPASPLATGGNPIGFLSLPSQPGADFIFLGSSTVDGIAVHGYSVIFSGSSLRRLASTAGLSAPDQALQASRPYQPYRERSDRRLRPSDRSHPSSARRRRRRQRIDRPDRLRNPDQHCRTSSQHRHHLPAIPTRHRQRPEPGHLTGTTVQPMNADRPNMTFTWECNSRGYCRFERALDCARE